MNNKIALNISGKTISWALISEEHKIIKQGLFEQNLINIRTEDMVSSITKVVQEIEKENGSVETVSISLPGVVNNVTSELIEGARWMKSIEPTTILKDLFKEDSAHEYKFNNDANSALVGFMHENQISKKDNVVYLICETGIGAGLFLNGKIYMGSKFLSGEIGKSKVQGTTVESVLSLSTVLAHASLVTGAPVTNVEELIEARKASEEVSKSIDNWYDSFIEILRNIVLFYDPNIVAITSQIIEAGIFTIEDINRSIAKLFSPKWLKNLKFRLVEGKSETEYSLIGTYLLN